MAKILPVASGKGGVGKTILTANLGIILAEMGQKTIIVDLDLGGSNLHTILGIKNDIIGLGHFINHKDMSFSDIVHDTKYPGLQFIPGDALFVGTANLQFFKKKQIIKGLMSLDADWIILDLGAGTSANTLDFYSISKAGIMVAIPEITSILNLYSFLKNAYYRYILSHFKRGDIIRDKIIEGGSLRLEKDDFRLIEYVRLIKRDNPERADEIDNAVKGFYPKLILNMSKHERDLNLGENLRGIIHKNLGIDAEYLGILPFENEIEECLNERMPIFEKNKNSKWVRNVEIIAERLINFEEYPISLFDGNSLDNVTSDFDY